VSDERIKQIRERLEAATPGPWTVLYDDGSLHGTPEEWFVNFDAHHDTTNIDREPDAAFIANAPADIAYLLERVKTLESSARLTVTELERYYRDGSHPDISPVLRAAKKAVES